MDGITALVGLGAVLATVGGIAWLLYRGVELYFRVRPHLRGHVFAATLWSLVMLVQTAALLATGKEANSVGQATALLAGSVMVWSWAQFAERQSGTTVRQERRPLLARLFVQTFWGVLALWATTWGIITGANAWFDDALTARDIATISRLHALGFRGADDRLSERNEALVKAVQEQDRDAVRAYLAAGVNPSFADWDGSGDPFVGAVIRKSVAITEMLLEHGYPYRSDVPLLQTAVQSGQLGQVRFLLRRGCDANEVGQKTHFTALQIAKQRGDKPMITLLKSAGATK